MELRHLRYFLPCETETYPAAKAGSHLAAVSQPPVRELEKEIGDPLLTRGARGPD